MRTSSVMNAGYQPSTPQQENRAASEPPNDAPSAIPGGEMLSLPPQTNSDSPMPELLSLKDRLQLFEKEIKQQTVPIEPKKDRKFSFLSEDELRKMKEEEAARIASMTRLDLETLDSLTSQLSTEDASTLLEELEGGQVNVEDELDTVRENTTAELIEAEGDEFVKEARSAWRKERLRSFEEDENQAQNIVDRITELSKYSEEDNGNYLESGQKTIELLQDPAVSALPTNNDNNMDITETESDVQTSKHTDI